MVNICKCGMREDRHSGTVGGPSDTVPYVHYFLSIESAGMPDRFDRHRSSSTPTPRGVLIIRGGGDSARGGIHLGGGGGLVIAPRVTADALADLSRRGVDHVSAIMRTHSSHHGHSSFSSHHGHGSCDCRSHHGHSSSSSHHGHGSCDCRSERWGPKTSSASDSERYHRWGPK